MGLCSRMFSVKPLVYLNEDRIQVSTLSVSDHQKINHGRIMRMLQACLENTTFYRSPLPVIFLR